MVNPQPRSILIVAGEASGDLHGAALIQEILKRDSSIHIWGIGGRALEAAGVELVAHSSDLAVTGLLEVFFKLRKIFSLFSLLLKRSVLQKPSLALLIDYPDFNLRLARKLHQKGILYTVNGVNFRVVYLVVAKVDVAATDTTAIISEFKDCPFFLNALITSGKHNLCLLFTATDLKRLEGIVNYHLRGNPKVKDIEMNIIISTAKDFILPLNIDYENQRQLNCKQECIEACSFCKDEK